MIYSYLVGGKWLQHPGSSIEWLLGLSCQDRSHNPISKKPRLLTQSQKPRSVPQINFPKTTIPKAKIDGIIPFPKIYHVLSCHQHLKCGVWEFFEESFFWAASVRRDLKEVFFCSLQLGRNLPVMRILFSWNLASTVLIETKKSFPRCLAHLFHARGLVKEQL